MVWKGQGKTMNNLQLHTRTENSTICVYWKTGQNSHGRFTVAMPAMEDAEIAAELAVAQLLLEERNACGHDKTGAGLCLEMTFGAIRRLLRGVSDKEHLAPYVLFLRTRFNGAELAVAKRADWVSEVSGPAEPLAVSGPRPTVIDVGGIGPVELTAHAFDQYVARFESDPDSKKIWRRLQKLARAASPVSITGRSAFHDVKHRRQGTFALNATADFLVVVVPESGGRRKLVTVYRPSDHVKRNATARCQSLAPSGTTP